jgi:hypothetical protein
MAARATWGGSIPLKLVYNLISLFVPPEGRFGRAYTERKGR